MPEVIALSSPTDDPAAISALLGRLNAGERERAASFRREADRCLWITARARLRETLARPLGIAPEALHFTEGQHQKPRLQGAPSGFDFNLSHTEGLIAIAWSDRAFIGIDCEALSRRVEDRIVHRYFEPEEIAWIEVQDGLERERQKLNNWVLREALWKAYGLGLAGAINRVGFRVQAGTISFSGAGLAGSQTLAISLYEVRGTHLVAVAALSPEAPPPFAHPLWEGAIADPSLIRKVAFGRTQIAPPKDAPQRAQ